MLEESVHLDASMVGCVVVLSDGRIDHQDKLLLAVVQVLDDLPHPVKREAIGVEGEDSAMVHVVNVRPHGPTKVSAFSLPGWSVFLLKRDPGRRVVRDDLCNIEPVLVTVLALVELRSESAKPISHQPRGRKLYSKTPVRNHGRCARKSRVLAGYFDGRRSGEEVEVEYSSDDVVLE